MDWKPVARVAAGLAVAAALLAAGARHAKFVDLPEPRLLALAAGGALALYALSWAFRARRLHALARASGARASRSALLGVHLQAYAWNVALPAKAGDAAQVALLARHGMASRDALALSVLLRLLDLVALLALGVAGVLAVHGVAGGPRSVAYAAAAAAALLVAGAILVRALPRSNLAARLDARLPRALRERGLTLAGTADAVGRLAAGPGSARVLALTFLVWLAEVASAGVVASAFGLPPLAAVAAVSAANLAKALPVTPGGIGVYELVFAQTIASAGGAFEAGFAAAVLDHGIKTLAVLAGGGGVALAWGLRGLRAAPAVPRDAEDAS